MSLDPYDALGVAKTASQADIKKAYKRIARESHPDLNPGDPGAADRFRDAASAWDLLKDTEKRARFDRGEIDASGQEKPERKFYREYAESPDATYHSERGYRDFQGYSDVFDDLFGARQRAGGQGMRMRGPDARYALDIGFLDAAKGATRRITLPEGGTLDVKIPQGVADGQVIRLRGKGGAGIGGGAPGDALVTLSVGAHPVFRREGADILIELPITLDEAVLGGQVRVPTIDGPVGMTIPAGASTGRVMRLRGRGVKTRSGQGDQLVSLKIVSPPEIDDALADFMRDWREKNPYDPRKGMT